MLISYNWIKDYVKLADSVTAEEVAEKLKLSTVEVEGIFKQGELLSNVVVGQILKIEKHPAADKLKVCEVDIGSEKSTIVCGGSNLSEGMLVAVAKVGAEVKWHGEGEPVKLEKTAIRGVESAGMICGADEIGVEELFPKKEEKEIVDLTNYKNDGKSLKPGQELRGALKLTDSIFEIDNKSLSNRPDLWGHYGLSREVAALNNRKVADYEVKQIKEKKDYKLKVDIEKTESCPRYMAVAVKNVKITDSPAWMKQRLASVGLRPINSVVDITNYIMLDLGQPMHAFDASKIGTEEGCLINVRLSEAGEVFTTLDEKERRLPQATVMICAGEKAIAIGGIMGGLASGVTTDTTTVIFESANFDPVSIRKSSVALGLRTDASARFEKGLDPSMCETALNKAVELLLEVCPEAEVASKVVDEGITAKKLSPIEMKTDFISKYLGVEISVKEIVNILTRLGFEVKEKGEYFDIIVPSWRSTDTTTPEAIVEEVVRIYGYQNIKGSLPSFTIHPPETNFLRQLEKTAADFLVKEFASTEVYNYSFVSGEDIDKIGDRRDLYLELGNPLSKEKPFLRRSLIINLLETLAKNGSKNTKMFEIGAVFTPELPGFRAETGGEELLPRQDKFLNVLFSAKENPFRRAQEAMERLAAKTGYELTMNSKRDVLPWQHPVRVVEVFAGENQIGEIYEVHPKVLKKFGIDERVGILSVNLSELSNLNPVKAQKYEPISEFPVSERDLAFLIQNEITNAEIVTALSGIDPILTGIKLFDVYNGAGEKKSMAYHLTFAGKMRTLTTEEVESALQKIKDLLVKKWSAEIR